MDTWTLTALGVRHNLEPRDGKSKTYFPRVALLLRARGGWSMYLAAQRQLIDLLLPALRVLPCMATWTLYAVVPSEAVSWQGITRYCPLGKTKCLRQ